MNPVKPELARPRAGRLLGPIAFMLAVLSLPAMQGCGPTERVDVNSSIGPGVSFEDRGDSFDWFPIDQPRSGDAWAELPNAHALFRETVQAELQTKGFRYESGGTAANRLADYLIRRTVGNLADVGKDRHINKVTLDVIDPRSGKRVWRTSAEVEMEPAHSPEQIRERLRLVVKKMLAPVKARTKQASRLGPSQGAGDPETF